MNGGQVRVLKEAVVAIFKVLIPCILLEILRNTTENLRTVGNPADIPIR
jgi:hypothetical protein